MMLSLATALGAIFISGVSCHQLTGILLVNGTESPEWKYVRNAFYWAATTETADILAGSEVGFRVSTDGNGKYGYFWHPGPGMIYLSRAPNDDLEHYRGDGDWFKIAYGGPVILIAHLKESEANQVNRQFNFTIPETTPPGKYLLRIEQFMPTTTRNYTQWYVHCAHVNIMGPGGGTPTEFARFPGTYVVDQPGVLIPENQFLAGSEPEEGFKLFDYRPPGPAVWSG
ncbi:hypothetical protein CHGG_05259 [Chaetomium globosum CBS 148.51]|uniref:lytic cellulose monooxygenase (C4-dehydrogenating) n=1 Tax=Chaetomium globosum (strain ATCC 6205 / CBS 148.51 / DSM 1962 / NBRC 6347 / NRRL 1970) TaxID=306901 RepID=Q2GYY7_CHAGB|nr:uncharacterized protein CHGG_05259 [Chaetomium globosum CBS 148.51]EAQ88640.1 hypothetical protein CHGG_05259 [Chaetomium globosum CBS 148.51]